MNQRSDKMQRCEKIPPLFTVKSLYTNFSYALPHFCQAAQHFCSLLLHHHVAPIPSHSSHNFADFFRPEDARTKKEARVRACNCMTDRELCERAKIFKPIASNVLFCAVFCILGFEKFTGAVLSYPLPGASACGSHLLSSQTRQPSYAHCPEL